MLVGHGLSLRVVAPGGGHAIILSSSAVAPMMMLRPITSLRASLGSMVGSFLGGLGPACSSVSNGLDSVARPTDGGGAGRESNGQRSDPLGSSDTNPNPFPRDPNKRESCRGRGKASRSLLLYGPAARLRRMFAWLVSKPRRLCTARASSRGLT